MNSLKHKLVISYGLLIVIIFAISVWSVYNFARLGQSVNTILVNNYKSILAAENMKEALERQDSAAMFFLAKEKEKAQKQFTANSEKFSQEYKIISNNITEPGEDKLIVDIGTQYSAYKKALDSFINLSEQNNVVEPSSIYFTQLEPEFIALKTKLDELLRINQKAMVAANDRTFEQAWHAEIFTILIAALSLLVALILSWKFTDYVINPISKFTKTAKEIAEGDFEQYVDIKSRDEIGVLANEFNRMAAKLRDMKKMNYWKILMEQKKSDAVIDSIYEPVIVTDAQGHITKINRAATELFSQNLTDEEDDISASDLTLTGFGAGDRILNAVKDVISFQRPIAAEGDAAIVPIKVGDAEKSFRLRTTPMRDSNGKLIGAVSLLEDITELREVDRVKTEFVSVASSKMRQPLHSLQMALYSLIEGYTGDFNIDQLEFLLSARADAEQLDELMQDLMELAEIETGTLGISLEPLNPIDLARTIIDKYSSAAESKHISLINKIPATCSRILADRKATLRILDNLLSNAIRHTPRDGEITISVEEQKDNVVFSVSDTGEGIDEKYLPNIFGRFVHIEGKAGGGTGLGLAIVKRLVEEQKGQVSVVSKVGQGTTFSFMLPIANTSLPKLEKRVGA